MIFAEYISTFDFYGILSRGIIFSQPKSPEEN